MSNKNWDTDWLNFSKRARRGALVFLFLFVVIAIAPSLYWNYLHDSDIDPEIIKLSGSLDHQEYKKNNSKGFSIPTTPFDPNEYKKEDWVNIGLSEKQAQSILNYLGKGGELRYKQDVKKLYVISDELYHKLEPVLSLPDKLVVRRDDGEKIVEDTSEPNQSETNFIEDHQITLTVEINSATAEELVQVKGIGDFYAEKIIEIRKSYGGIHSLDQLSGLYKMTPDKLDSLSKYITIDQDRIVKMNINRATKSKLASHPLLNADEANSIVFIRERFGEYESLDGLLQSPYIDQEKLKEIKPYLRVK